MNKSNQKQITQNNKPNKKELAKVISLSKETRKSYMEEIPQDQIETGGYQLSLNKDYERLAPDWFNDLNTFLARYLWIEKLKTLGNIEPRVKRSREALEDKENSELRSIFGWATFVFCIPIVRLHLTETCFGKIEDGKVDSEWFKLPKFVAKKLDITPNGMFNRKIKISSSKLLSKYRTDDEFVHLHSLTELNNLTRYSLRYIAGFVENGLYQGLFAPYTEDELSLPIVQNDIGGMSKRQKRINDEAVAFRARKRANFGKYGRKRGQPFGNKAKGNWYRYIEKPFEDIEPY